MELPIAVATMLPVGVKGIFCAILLMGVFGGDACDASGDYEMKGPLHLKTLIPDEVRLALERDARLLVPVGTCEQHGPHLPLGCDTVIVERLEDERGLDLRDLEVIVENAEVTLNGTVRHKADKRRIEDVAEIDGVRHVQNNLRLRTHSHWTFL